MVKVRFKETLGRLGNFLQVKMQPLLLNHQPAVHLVRAKASKRKAEGCTLRGLGVHVLKGRLLVIDMKDCICREARLEPRIRCHIVSFSVVSISVFVCLSLFLSYFLFLSLSRFSVCLPR